MFQLLLLLGWHKLELESKIFTGPDRTLQHRNNFLPVASSRYAHITTTLTENWESVQRVETDWVGIIIEFNFQLCGHLFLHLFYWIFIIN